MDTAAIIIVFVLGIISCPFGFFYVRALMDQDHKSVGDTVNEATDRWLTEAPAALFPNQKRYYRAVCEGKIAYLEYEGVLDEEVLGLPLPDGWREEIEKRIGGRPEDNDEVLRSTKDPNDFFECPDCGGKFRLANMNAVGICQKCWHKGRKEKQAVRWTGTENEWYEIDQQREKILTMHAVPPMLLLPDGQQLHQGETREVQLAGMRQSDSYGYMTAAQMSEWLEQYSLNGDKLVRKLVQRDRIADELMEKVLETQFFPVTDLKDLRKDRFEMRRDKLINKLNEPRKLLRGR